MYDARIGNTNATRLAQVEPLKTSLEEGAVQQLADVLTHTAQLGMNDWGWGRAMVGVEGDQRHTLLPIAQAHRGTGGNIDFGHQGVRCTVCCNEWKTGAK